MKIALAILALTLMPLLSEPAWADCEDPTALCLAPTGDGGNDSNNPTSGGFSGGTSSAPICNYQAGDILLTGPARVYECLSYISEIAGQQIQCKGNTISEQPMTCLRKDGTNYNNSTLKVVLRFGHGVGCNSVKCYP